MEPGERVRLRGHAEMIDRRVIWISSETIAVCTDEEYEAARSEGREPVVVGFPISAVEQVERSA